MRVQNGIRIDLSKAVAAAEAAALAAARVVAAASLAVTPDDPATGGGDLRSSQKVTSDRSATKGRAAVSYGTRQAVPQHQRTDYRHRPGQQAKFLEQPLHQSASAALQAGAVAARKVTR